jgi:2-polyprenyl-3-methyl-5-hydroxy-6-metoxy-1,4-benzoquinol methylase
MAPASLDLDVFGKNVERPSKFLKSIPPHSRAGEATAMSVLERETGLDELKTRFRNTWMTDDYGRFSRYMERDAEAFHQRLPITPGAQLLDVGCGAGQLSLIAARAGERVTGCDIASNWLVQARRSAAAEGLTVVLEEGDAEALPYQDVTFDAEYLQVVAVRGQS